MVRDGATAGSVGRKAAEGLIEYAKKNSEGAMEDIDNMLDLGEFEGGIMFYFS